MCVCVCVCVRESECDYQWSIPENLLCDANTWDVLVPLRLKDPPTLRQSHLAHRAYSLETQLSMSKSYKRSRIHLSEHVLLRELWYKALLSDMFSISSFSKTVSFTVHFFCTFSIRHTTMSWWLYLVFNCRYPYLCPDEPASRCCWSQQLKNTSVRALICCFSFSHATVECHIAWLPTRTRTPRSSRTHRDVRVSHGRLWWRAGSTSSRRIGGSIPGPVHPPVKCVRLLSVVSEINVLQWLWFYWMCVCVFPLIIIIIILLSFFTHLST